MAHSYEHRVDPHIHRQGYLPGNDYALPHLSRFTQQCTADELAVLGHVNCGHLSTPGVPPTLLTLKQHAQSLCYLIAMLEPHHGEPTDVGLGGLGDDDDDDDDMKGTSMHPDDVRLADPSGPLPVPGLVRPEPGKGKKDQRKRNKSNKIFKSKTALSLSTNHDPLTPNPFDWLQDLSKPYSSDDPDHHRPLFDLVNEVQAHHDVLGTTYRCPLERYCASGSGPYWRGDGGNEHDDNNNNNDGDADMVQDGNIVRPYASHHNLLMHANMCLERLDHEFAATGGLLSMLPTGVIGEKKEENGGPAGPGWPRGQNQTTAGLHAASRLASARNSLVGQWLTFTQQLVGRMHELEISYGNALTALAGEASVPGRVGLPGGGQGVPRDQDRWILANAGDDVWSFLHTLLDQEGKVDEARHAAWQAEGVVGEGGGSSLLCVDVNTRFYRVGPNKGPIFVCPAWSAHPGVQPTGRTLESKPAVVVIGGNASILGEPQASALERRYEAQLRAAGRLTRQNERLAERIRDLEATMRREGAQRARA